MSDWQPIETAPRGGTEILLCRGDRVTSGSYFGGDTPFEPDVAEREDWDSCWTSWDGGFLVDCPPTHWHPLPAPPSEGE